MLPGILPREVFSAASIGSTRSGGHWATSSYRSSFGAAPCSTGIGAEHPHNGPFERRICSLNVHENEENRECGCKSRFSEEQIVRIIQEYAAGAKVSELCRKHGMSDATFYKWKARYGGLQISDVRRLKDLESENGKLKKLLAETMLDNAGLKGLLAKNF